MGPHHCTHCNPFTPTARPRGKEWERKLGNFLSKFLTSLEREGALNQ